MKYLTLFLTAYNVDLMLFDVVYGVYDIYVVFDAVYGIYEVFLTALHCKFDIVYGIYGIYEVFDIV